MMKKFILIAFILLLGENHLSYGQVKVENENSSMYNEIPQEKLFAHINSSFLLTGEHLLYKIYCLNAKTGKQSDISKIAYVELINSNRDLIFKHKVRLDSGLGQGDFFIPTSVLSGNYKIIAYTQWMRNGDEINFFMNDISIINPFNENQNEIIYKNELNDTIKNNKLSESKNKLINEISYNSSDLIKLKLEKSDFKNREKVIVKINSLNEEEPFGNYSISVRKKGQIKNSNLLTSITYTSSFSKNEISNSKDPIYLPEVRGELLSGKVGYIDSKKLASNIKVALSIPGKDYIFKISNTNNQGVFYFNLDEQYKGSDAIIQVITNEGKNLEIILDKQKSINYRDIKFNKFRISKEEHELILQHSIYNQIENAYLGVKKDIIDEIESDPPFYGSSYKEYLLDDYTRFPTIKETIIEIVDFIYIKHKKGKNTLGVIGTKENYDSGLLPLVLLDGQLIQDHEKLLDFNAKKVKKINVVNEKYSYGSQLFEGVISFETIEGNFKNGYFVSNLKMVKLFKPLQTKSYFNQVYDNTDKFARIPDYRNQLLWQPNFYLNKKEESITFFTSDNKGDYEICLEGFTKEGMPVSLRETFSVK